MATSFRVILNGNGYDLLDSFQRARMSDFDALLLATGRNPFAVSSGIKAMDQLKALDEEGREKALAGHVGNQLMQTITDLVFLARRDAGEKLARPDGTTDPDRPISYSQSADTLSFFEVMGAFSAAAAAAEAAQVEEDPTTAQTVSDLGVSASRAAA